MRVLEEFSKVIANKNADNPIFLTGLSIFWVIAITLRKIVNFLSKAKELIFNLAPVRHFFISIVLIAFLGSPVMAQVRNDDQTGAAPDSVVQQNDPSMQEAQQDLSTGVDSLVNKSDTTKIAPAGD